MTNATMVATAWDGSPTQVTASTSETSPIVSAIDPAMSNRAARPGSMCGTATIARMSATTPTGALIQKIQGQPQ